MFIVHIVNMFGQKIVLFKYDYFSMLLRLQHILI